MNLPIQTCCKQYWLNVDVDKFEERTLVTTIKNKQAKTPNEIRQQHTQKETNECRERLDTICLFLYPLVCWITGQIASRKKRLKRTSILLMIFLFFVLPFFRFNFRSKREKTRPFYNDQIRRYVNQTREKKNERIKQQQQMLILVI
jgi:hypothetical protein